FAADIAIRASFALFCSAPSGAASPNHRLRSGPTQIPVVAFVAVGIGNSVMTPAGPMRPSLLPRHSVNHRLPSGAEAMRQGLPGAGISEIVPSGLIHPMRLRPHSVNQ